MTERIVEQGVEIAKIDGLFMAVVEVKKDDGIPKDDEKEVIEEIITLGIEENIFSDTHVRDARRAAIIAQNSLKHRRKRAVRGRF